jgi:hypothetical protein
MTTKRKKKKRRRRRKTSRSQKRRNINPVLRILPDAQLIRTARCRMLQNVALRH